MKYLNQVNIVLVIVSAVVVGYALTTTIWGPEPELPLNIPISASEPRSSRPTRSLSPGSPEPRSPGSRRPQQETAAPGKSPLDPVKASSQAPPLGTPSDESEPNDSQGAMASAPSADAPAPKPSNSEATRAITIVGGEPESVRAEQPRPQAVRKSRAARQRRTPSRLPVGRSRLTGGGKRDRQDDGPPSPPVRSSFPAQRLP